MNFDMLKKLQFIYRNKLNTSSVTVLYNIFGIDGTKC